jgi:hypothetical protein
MNEEQKRQFFAGRHGPTHSVNMGGKKLALANFPEDKKQEIMNILVSKDPLLKAGQEGILPGIMIDGKQVTRNNIKDFEVKDNKKIEEPKIEPIKEELKPVEKVKKTKIKKEGKK